MFSLVRDWSKRVMWLNMPQLKLINIRVIFTNFQNRAYCKKYLKNNKHNSFHLARKYARIFFLGHYLFLKAHSLSRATLSKNCSLLKTDKSADKYPSVFSRQMKAIVYIYSKYQSSCMCAWLEVLCVFVFLTFFSVLIKLFSIPKESHELSSSKPGYSWYHVDRKSVV